MFIVFSIFVLFIIDCSFAEYEPLAPPPKDFKGFMLREHNKYRGMLRKGPVGKQPQAKSMPDLKWNEKLVATAQKHADDCVPRHDTYAERATKGFEYVGQNLYAGPKVQDSTVLWWIEYKWYDYYTLKCQPGKICGHYTQLVWAESTEVGCVYKDCTSDKFPYGYVVVCNYGEAGNWDGEHPYVKK